ncbi:malonate transporter subunit MadM [Methylobacterium brachiatum]|uniref:malonate transporter subunit MadM n=1 Tax=Methylobacterium brachiatum TaxID=269660 RepID=UPI0008E0E2DF|nr:malonate transporter subunit MadM [Methylobacterium brachiatum]SFI25076.1 malonate transporter, MadM subunit [Methylobacterium brachiatum]
MEFGHDVWHGIEHVFIEQSLVAAFAVVGALILVSNLAAKRFTKGRVHGSAIAIVLGLALAYLGGLYTGGKKGIADIPALAGIGLMGGAMLRDFAIVATAFEVDVTEARRAGLIGVLALALGTIIPFLVGTLTAVAFGYHDAVSITTIGAGAITYIVGPVTGAAIGADSTVMALSIATGVTKAVMVMVGTPLVAKLIGLDNPRSAMAYGGLMGTVSGVAGGLAATDPKLVPYGALTATFHTGIGCLVGPSIFYLTVRALVG